MYHPPRSDTHVGRHARHKAPAAAPAAPPRDRHGRQIPPPPPRPVFNATGPLHTRGGHLDTLTVVCWEALCATNPAALDGTPERREAAYRGVADTIAARLATAVSPPRHRHLIEWVAAACAAQLDAQVLWGRTRRCAGWILHSGEWRWHPPRRTPR